MAGFKEKPKMSSGGGLGQNFRKVEDNGSSNGKKILYILLAVLAVILIINAFSDDTPPPKQVGSKGEVSLPKSSIPEYTATDNFTGSYGKQYTIFKVKLTKELANRIYVEQNSSKRSINSLLEKISRDKMAKTSISNSLFKDETKFFAITAAMFEEDNLPPGLLVSGSMKHKNLNLQDGDGNFYLKPNGVFSISRDGVVQIQETLKFDQSSLNSFAFELGILTPFS